MLLKLMILTSANEQNIRGIFESPQTRVRAVCTARALENTSRPPPLQQTYLFITVSDDAIGCISRLPVPRSREKDFGQTIVVTAVDGALFFCAI
ncbi:hypothetical protein [Mycolicibacterium goodii]|uniref:hypothetical protein n=1 Tax=Mycolicibacterium goodii TaxID=134601 RepID=UPI0012FF7B85